MVAIARIAAVLIVHHVYQVAPICTASNTRSWGPHELTSNTVLDRFSRFCNRDLHGNRDHGNFAESVKIPRGWKLMLPGFRRGGKICLGTPAVTEKPVWDFRGSVAEILHHCRRMATVYCSLLYNYVLVLQPSFYRATPC